VQVVSKKGGRGQKRIVEARGLQEHSRDLDYSIGDMEDQMNLKGSNIGNGGGGTGKQSQKEGTAGGFTSEVKRLFKKV
jgi:hypothetical protein